MKVFVTGGSGFVGRALVSRLLEAGSQVTVLTRSDKAAARLPPGAAPCRGDPTAPGGWQEAAASHDAFVNLAGASIFHRWSRSYKDLLRSSRLLTTRNLVQAMAKRRASRPPVLVSASAVGFYGPRGGQELDEGSPPGNDFLARLCLDWEAGANQARELGARVVTARLGIVLGPGGGALGRMLPAFRLGLGGPLGGGGQWFSWIHRHDLADALVFCLEKEIKGPVNCCAPEPVTNREMSTTLGRVLGKPAFLPVPGLAVKLALGEMG